MSRRRPRHGVPGTGVDFSYVYKYLGVAILLVLFVGLCVLCGMCAGAVQGLGS